MKPKNKESPGKRLANGLDTFLSYWHQFPVDFWWRKKYRIPFGSPEHRAMNLIDIYIEYQEERLIEKYQEEAREKEEMAENKTLNIGNSKNEVVKMSKKEIKDDYDNLELSQFDKKEE